MRRRSRRVVECAGGQEKEQLENIEKKRRNEQIKNREER